MAGTDRAGARYAAVDRYLDDLYGPTDPVLQRTTERTKEAGIPQIAVSANLGRFLQVLALACRARRILEIGTLAGYSAVWLARALPPRGYLLTLEADPRHAAVARRNFADAGLTEMVDVREGDARSSLADLEREGVESFDMVFIDADKSPYADYLASAVRLSRPGTLIVADNVIRDGRVADGPSDDEAVAGVQRFNAVVASHDRLTSAIVQQVGVKGYDGMALAVVTA